MGHAQCLARQTNGHARHPHQHQHLWDTVRPPSSCTVPSQLTLPPHPEHWGARPTHMGLTQQPTPTSSMHHCRNEVGLVGGAGRVRERGSWGNMCPRLVQPATGLRVSITRLQNTLGRTHNTSAIARDSKMQGGSEAHTGCDPTYKLLSRQQWYTEGQQVLADGVRGMMPQHTTTDAQIATTCMKSIISWAARAAVTSRCRPETVALGALFVGLCRKLGV